MAISNKINNIYETAQLFQSSVYDYLLENFGSLKTMKRNFLPNMLATQNIGLRKH